MRKVFLLIKINKYLQFVILFFYSKFKYDKLDKEQQEITRGELTNGRVGTLKPLRFSGIDLLENVFK